jgi:hypothetical protein
MITAAPSKRRGQTKKKVETSKTNDTIGKERAQYEMKEKKEESSVKERQSHLQQHQRQQEQEHKLDTEEYRQELQSEWESA